MKNQIQDLGDMLAEYEAELLVKGRAEIEAERVRYETDPAYRAAVDAKRAKFQAELEAAEVAGAFDETDDEDDDDEDEDDDREID